MLANNTNRAADFNYIIELERQKRNISFDEEINYDIPLLELDLSLIERAFIKLNKSLNREKLLNLKLIKTENNNDYPTISWLYFMILESAIAIQDQELVMIILL